MQQYFFTCRFCKMWICLNSRKTDSKHWHWVKERVEWNLYLYTTVKRFIKCITTKTKKHKKFLVWLSNPPFKYGKPRFTEVPLKALSDQVWIRDKCLCFFKLFIFICFFLGKWLADFLFIRSNGETHQNKVSRVPL